MEQLILKNVKVLFTEFKNKDFGSSITIDVADDKIRSSVEEFVKEKNIKGGKLNVKDYTNPDTKEETKQLTLKLAEFASVLTANEELEGIDAIASQARKIGLGRGAVVDLVYSPFEYDNNFGKGVSASITAIKITTPAVSKNAADLLK